MVSLTIIVVTNTFLYVFMSLKHLINAVHFGGMTFSDVQIKKT